MRKLSLGIFFIVVGVILVSPFLMGVTAQKSFESYIQYINSQTPAVQLKIEDYQKGWLTSKAVIGMNIDLDKPIGDVSIPFKLKFIENIHHGPILFDMNFKLAQAYFETSFNLSDATKKKLGEFVTFAPGFPSLSSNILLTLQGNFEGTFQLPEFRVTSLENKDHYMVWKGLEGNTTFDRSFTKTAGQAKMKGLTLTGKKSALNMGDTDLRYNLIRKEHELWTGDITVKQNDVVAQDNQDEVFKLTSFTVKSVTQLVNDFLSYHFNFDLNKLFAESKEYGPFSVDLHINNLDAKVVSRLQENIEKANNPNLSETERQMIVMAVLPSLPGILTAMTEFTVDASLKLPQGLMTSKGSIRVNGDPTSAGMFNVMKLRSQLQANLDTKLPVAVLKEALLGKEMIKLQKEQILLVRQAKAHQENQTGHVVKPLTAEEIKTKSQEEVDAKLAKWEGAGFLQRSEDNYIINLWIDKGQLKVNGRMVN